MTDIDHPHLAITVFFMIAGYMCRTNKSIGHGLNDILNGHKDPFIGQPHKDLYEIIIMS